MNVVLLRTASRSPNHFALHSRKITKALDSFAPKHREAVKNIANKHLALADLALSFPALLFALAVPNAGLDNKFVSAKVIAGLPLKQLAKAAGLPFWIRKLPPAAFTRAIRRLPDGEIFVRQIANHLPRKSKHAALWLDYVSSAAIWGHDAFAVWVAQNLSREPNAFQRRGFTKLTLWAFFSTAADTKMSKLIATKWRPEVKLRQARDAANDWFVSLDLTLMLENDLVDDMWLKPAHIEGYDFVALATGRDIAEEAAFMRNCIRSWGSDVAHNSARLWSIRKQGARIATLAVGPSYSDDLLVITELKLRDNNKVPKEIAVIARKWLNSHDIYELDLKAKEWGVILPDKKTWQELWRPYWLAKRKIPEWLTMCPQKNWNKRLSL